jgi:hypothetical protein
MTQFSLFGAAVAEPSLADLNGVLLAGGHLARLPDGVRLSVIVAERWRADALADEFALRDLADFGPVVPAEGGWSVRTRVAAELRRLADRWTRGARQEPPADLELTAGGLRLWVVATGRAEATGYLLATDQPDDATHRAAGAQLSRLGIAAVSVTQRSGPGWRVTSHRRIRRLVELVGAAPEGAARDWPEVSPHHA